MKTFYGVKFRKVTQDIMRTYSYVWYTSPQKDQLEKKESMLITSNSFKKQQQR